MDKIDYLKAWIVFFLITIFGSPIAGYLAGFILVSLGFDIETQAAVFKVFGFTAGILVSFFAYQFSVKTFIVEAIMKKTKAAVEDETLR